MEIFKKPFQEVPQFSAKDIAYATGTDALKPFYKYPVTMESFAKVIEDRKAIPVNRQVLVESLRRQYAGLATTELVKANIEALLSENTFTIITAHQPVLFTGPLYYIYKIISTIRLVENLSKTYPDYQFVPVFISGSEDHDFDEINHTHLFGRSVSWQNDEKGACGMMSTASLSTPLAELKTILGNDDRAQRAYQLIEAAYTGHQTYGAASQALVNSLFADLGLVVVNMNDVALKRLFIPYLEREIFEHFSHPYVTATQKELDQVGFGNQAYARDINVFYLREQIRARIEQDGDHYQVVDTDYRFSTEALKQEIHEHPEHFSPNVVLRPIYQEVIFPNLAYIGGGGELSYWLERKRQFEAFGLNFPMLIRRNSALWVDKGSAKKLQKTGLHINDLFEETEALLKHYVTENTENEINLKAEKAAIEEVLTRIATKATEVDPSLKGKVMAENAKIIKTIEQLEGRLMKAEKDRFEVALNQIRKLKEKLFPNNGLQERHENFLALYIRYGKDFFEILKGHLDPLEEGIVVFVEA